MLTDNVETPLREAINVIRDFVDAAERIIEREDAEPRFTATPEIIIGTIQSKLAWGMANASSVIRDALYAVSDDRRRDAES